MSRILNVLYAFFEKVALKSPKTLHDPTRFWFIVVKGSKNRREARETGNRWEQNMPGKDLHLSTMPQTTVR